MRKAERSLVVAVGLAVSLLVPATQAATPADRAATHAYLAADYAYEQALLAAVPARLAVIRSLAGQISAECPGILAHAPADEGFPAPPGRESARQRGERNRRREQLASLQFELALALSPSPLPPEREALATFIATARALRWSKPAITSRVARYLLALEERAAHEPGPPHVCADIAAWVDSGYRLLPAATRAVEAQPFVTIGNLVQAIAPTSRALAAYEGPQERRLIAQIRAARLRRPRGLAEVGEVLASVEADLGIHHGEDEPGLFPPPRPKAPPVVIGRGRTATGARFTVTFEPASGEHGCSLEISEGGAGSESFGTRGSACSFRSKAAEASVDCNSGLLTIQANTLPAARRVRLLLSDGRTIASPAIAIPARYGGPAGLYYQVVRGPAPIPVSLTELDRRGHALRTDRLPRIVECTKHPLKYLPGGIRTLVRSRIPGGAPFTIEAQRYRFLGKVHLDLKTYVETESASGGFALGEQSSGAIVLPPGRARKIFAPEEASGCKPKPYVIVFGVLKQPGDTVLARTATGLVPLHVQPMPASLHAGGALAWGAFSPPPTELLIRAHDGRTLLREPIAAATGEQVEQCEGEAEGG